MADNQIAARVTAFSTTQSPLPASFGNDSVLYGFALASLISISLLAIVIFCWMVRDIWRDKAMDHPTSLPFGFRGIIALICLAAILRCVPEVLTMTLYGEVTGAHMALIMKVKRYADTSTWFVVISWMAWLSYLYPHIMLELRSFRARTTVSLNFIGRWYTLVRPAAILVAVTLISALIASAKGQMGH